MWAFKVSHFRKDFEHFPPQISDKFTSFMIADLLQDMNIVGE